MRPDKQLSAYDKALTLLGIRMHTSFELQKKLKQKGFSDSDVQGAIERLKEERYLQDEDTAQVYLENLMRYKTFGYYGIKGKLLQKGIDSRTIERLLSENFSIEDEIIIAKKALEKSNKKDFLKLSMMLKRKGFRNEVISKLTRNNSFEDY